MSFVQGFKTRDFITDLLNMINDATEWTGGGGSDLFGAKPRISRRTERKVTGLAKRKSENIIISVDSEQVRAFQLGTAVRATHGDHYHTMAATIEVQTNVSEERFDQVIGAVKNILTTPANIRTAGYVQILIRGMKNLSPETRESWAGIIDVTGEALNPSYTP